MSEKTVGHIQCAAGNRAEVRQAVRRGNHFYTVCDCCGTNQGTGKARQQWIWDNAEFIAGATVKKPINVTDEKPVVSESSVESEPVQIEAGTGDFDPAEPVETESAPAVKTGETGMGSKLVGVGLLLASGLGAWLWNR
ncbi:hypothetical protein [Teredinibacter turnerae]|uniref:hypothetical protein n=1 Tax=Teredinibacter turnerae TaxID=2426 RepID=UPI0030D33718